MIDEEKTEELQSLQQRYVFNTFHLLDMGDDKHGIYGKCHTEALHAIEEGIIKYLLEILVDTVLTEADCTTFDEFIRCMCCQLGDHGKDNFPRTSWKNGFTKLTFIDAGDRVGKLFTATLFLVSQTGAELFDGFDYTMDRLDIKNRSKKNYGKRKKKKKTSKRNKSAAKSSTHDRSKKNSQQNISPSSDSDDTIHDSELRFNFVEVFEMILCLWAWLKQEEFWHPGDEEYESYIQTSIKTLITKLKELLPRGKGAGWDLIKIHALLHIVFDIMEVGAHRNVNSDKCESSHKHLIKKPARNAQRRVVSLDRSIANRQVDRLIIDHAFSALNHQKNRAESIQAETNTGKHLSTRGILTIEKTGDFSLGVGST